MALQIQKALKSSLQLANTRALSSGVFNGSGFDTNSEYSWNPLITKNTRKCNAMFSTAPLTFY